MKKINVLHVTPSLGGGGVEKLLVKSLELLDQQNYSHKVCCVSRGGVYESAMHRIGIPYVILNRRVRFDLSIVLQMRALMQKDQIDIVHTLNFTANTWGRISAKLAGIENIIAHERGTAWTETASMRLVDRFLYRFTDLILCNSEAARIMLIRKIGLPDTKKLRVVYNGMPINQKNADIGKLRHILQIPPLAPLVGAIGRLDTPKGFITLLRAIPSVWKQIPSAHFVIIGGGPLHQYLENEAHHLGLFDSDTFHMLGFLPDAAELMSDLDILVHPAIREALGNVLIESGLAGVPVITSNVDGCPEVVKHEKTGIVLNGKHPPVYVRASGASPLPSRVVDGVTRKLRPPLELDPNELANAIIKLIRKPGLRQQLGADARAFTRRQFSLEQYVREIEIAYQDVFHK